MISPQIRSLPLDLSAHALPPLWQRVRPTLPESREAPGGGLYRTGVTGQFRKAMIQALDQTRQVALVASFLLADQEIADAMLRAAGRKVRIYVLTASENRVAALPSEDDLFEQRMVDEHKALLEKLAGKVLLRSAEHFHAKFLVTDPWVPGVTPRAFLSTANFNKALTDGIELGLEVDHSHAVGLAQFFVWGFWTEAERELMEGRRLSAVALPPAMPTIPLHPTVFFTHKQSATLRAEIVRLFRSARKELKVSIFGLEEKHEVVQELVAAARRGVQVSVLTRPRPATLPALKLLVEAGVRVAAHDKLHAKAILVDGTEGLVMTANMQAHGLDQGFEVGVRVSGSQAGALATTLYEWEQSFPWKFHANARRGDFRGEICFADKGLRDGKAEVVAEEKLDLPPITARSALALDQAPDPELKVPLLRARIAQQVVYRVEIRAPELPKEAKPHLQVKQQHDKDGKVENISVPYIPPVYRDKNGLYVKLRSPEDIVPARKLADALGAVVVL